MITIDPLLLNLLEAAERGEKCPPLVLVVGTWIVQGKLVSTTSYLEENQAHVQKRVLSGLKAGDRAHPAAESSAAQVASQHLGALGTADGATPLCLSIIDATLASGATTITVPAIRVPVSAVDSWWVTDHYVEGQKVRGGGVGVGFAF